MIAAEKAFHRRHARTEPGRLGHDGPVHYQRRPAADCGLDGDQQRPGGHRKHSHSGLGLPVLRPGIQHTSVYIGTVTHTGGLAAAALHTRAGHVSLPNGLLGTFYVFVVADTNQSVYEQIPPTPTTPRRWRNPQTHQRTWWPAR